jgi:hypothetical protein
VAGEGENHERILAAVEANRDCTHLGECGERGAGCLRPFWQLPVEQLVLGSTHELAATIRQVYWRLDRSATRAACGRQRPESGRLRLTALRSDM